MNGRNFKGRYMVRWQSSLKSGNMGVWKNIFWVRFTLTMYRSVSFKIGISILGSYRKKSIVRTFQWNAEFMNRIESTTNPVYMNEQKYWRFFVWDLHNHLFSAVWTEVTRTINFISYFQRDKRIEMISCLRIIK